MTDIQAQQPSIPPSQPEMTRGTGGDPAGVLGMLAGVAAIACLLLGILMPLIPWVLAGVLGLIVLGCAFFSTSRLRWWLLGIGLAALLPPIILTIVQLLPSIQNR